MTFYIGATLFNIIVFYFLLGDTISYMLDLLPPIKDTGVIYGLLFKSLIGYWLIGLAIYIISQFSFLISQFYDRFRGLISITVFNLSCYLVFRLGGFLGPAFKWAPDIPVKAVNDTHLGYREFTIYVGTGPMIGSAIVLVGLFILGSWVLENQLEV